jgi:hypothetical protein
MIDKDYDVLWRPARIYIPAWQFQGLDYETTTTTDIKSIGTGSGNDSQIKNVNTSGVSGIGMTANATSVEHFMAIPGDLDISRPMYFRVYWTANNSSGSVTWDILHKPYVAGTTVVGTAKAAVVLSKAIGAHSMAGVAYTLMQTPEGRLNGGVLTEAQEVLQLAVVRTTAATITEAFFLGLEIRYSPRRLDSLSGMRNEAKASTYIGGKTKPN